MMIKQISKGLIYKTQDYKESSKLLFIYTKDGKKTLVAKGAKRFNSDQRYLSQYLTLISFVDSDKTMFDLKEGTLLEPFESIKADFNKIKYVSMVLEIIDKIYTNDLPNDKLFDLLLSFLTGYEPVVGSLSLALKFLYALGYGLNFKGDSPSGFNLESACVSTKENHLTISLNLESTVLLSKLYFLKIEDKLELTDAEIKVIVEFIKAFYQYHLEYNIKSIWE